MSSAVALATGGYVSNGPSATPMVTAGYIDLSKLGLLLYALEKARAKLSEEEVYAAVIEEEDVYKANLKEEGVYNATIKEC